MILYRKPFKAPGSRDIDSNQSPDYSSKQPSSFSSNFPTQKQFVPPKSYSPEENNPHESQNIEKEEAIQKGEIKIVESISKKLPANKFKPVTQSKVAQQINAQDKFADLLIYKCFWSKDVRKKHKVLDDGVIVYSGKKVQIYKSNGEKIHDGFKTKVYKPNPDNQEQYIIGSLFIEQDNQIKYEDFQSGSCFVKAKISYDKDQIALKKKIQAPFKSNKTVDSMRPNDVEIPAKSYLMTPRGHPDLFPVFIDPYLCEYMRPHQNQGVKFMFECITGMRGPDINGCILADSMGLGKTLQTIALIWVMLRRSKERKVLLNYRISNMPYQGPFSSVSLVRKVVVVAPVSLLGTWRKEVKKWLGDARLVPKIAIGNKDAVLKVCKEFAMSAQKMLLLISYDQFRINMDSFQDKCDLLVFDEGHRLKNMNIKTFRSFNQLKCNRRIILTGTPLQNSLSEFYSCVKFVNPNIFESGKQFRYVFSDPILNAMKNEASVQMIECAKERSKALSLIISRFVLRRKADILEKLLPPRSEYFVFLKLSQLQMDVYQKMIYARFHKIEFESETGAFSLLAAMRKLLNHPQLVHQDNTNAVSRQFKPHFPETFFLYKWDYSAKFAFTEDILDSMVKQEQATGQIERIIIVSYWTQTLDLLDVLVGERKLKTVRLDGSVNAQKRQEYIDRFQDPKSDIRVFLLCGKAGGTGLNLSAANRMILMEADWNPSNDLQVMGRIWRDGQKRPVHIYRLVACGTYEEKVLQRQFLKQDLSQNVVDEKLIEKQHNNDKMRMLFEYKGDQVCLCFKEEENQLGSFADLTPDFLPKMLNYISFVKQNIKGSEKKNQSPEVQAEIQEEAEDENEFGAANIFVNNKSTYENNLAGEMEEDQDESEEEEMMNEEAQERMRLELERLNEVPGVDGIVVEESKCESDSDSSEEELKDNSKKFKKE